MYSLVIPVYRNEASLPNVIAAVGTLNEQLGGKLEAIFVVDGSPDQSYTVLARQLPDAPFASKLVLLSRNFGSFPAIRAGMAAGEGPYYAVMAADLQEPPSLILEMFEAVSSEEEETDIAVGTRASRQDPLGSRLSSQAFWFFYRRLVQKDMPPGGIDVFACRQEVRDQILALPERNSTLVGLLLWVGFRRNTIPYGRQEREHGKSAWTFRKKMRYMLDSIFAFTDKPIWLMLIVGVAGAILAAAYLTIVLIAYATGHIDQPGFPTIVGLILAFGMVNLLATGIVGAYAWRAFENSKGRPEYIVKTRRRFGPGAEEA